MIEIACTTVYMNSITRYHAELPYTTFRNQQSGTAEPSSQACQRITCPSKYTAKHWWVAFNYMHWSLYLHGRQKVHVNHIGAANLIKKKRGGGWTGFDSFSLFLLFLQRKYIQWAGSIKLIVCCVIFIIKAPLLSLFPCKEKFIYSVVLVHKYVYHVIYWFDLCTRR